MTNWKEYRLSDLMQIKYGKDHKHLADGTYPLYGSGGIMRYVEKPLYDDESILIPRKGTLSNLFYLDQPFWSVDTMFYSKINKDLVLPKYLFYTLKTFDLASLNVGSAVPSLTTEVLNEVLVSIPDLPTQTAIAEILSSLDDKIELNNKINQELENLAQTLFKQWFIDFEFPNEKGEPYKSSGGEMVESELGEIPKGWEVGTLSEILDVKGGTTPSTKETKYWNGSINWSSPRDLSNLKFPLLIDTEKKITELGLSKISSGLLPKGTLLLSSRAPIGYLAITNIETAINQGYIAINGKGGYSNVYILYWLKANMNLVVERANGSTFLEISKSNFKQINCVIPALNSLNSFTSQVHILFDQLRNNILENQQLTDLRDTLLPKLISGELEVSQITNEKE
jgi:type I restriction enzyme, S subunit